MAIDVVASHFPETTPQGRDDVGLHVCGPQSGAWQRPILWFWDCRHVIATRMLVYLQGSIYDFFGHNDVLKLDGRH
jgi:hypothetical protein